MIQINTGRMNRASENAWQDFFVTSFEPLSCEKNKKFTSFDDGADTVINSSLILQMPDEGSAILIFYNHSSLALYFCARDYTSAHLRCETD